MITKTVRQLVEIEHEIGVTWLLFHTGQMSRSQANEKIQELEDEKEHLWVLEY